VGWLGLRGALLAWADDASPRERYQKKKLLMNGIRHVRTCRGKLGDYCCLGYGRDRLIGTCLLK
jgi:hypothetical protein